MKDKMFIFKVDKETFRELDEMSKDNSISKGGFVRMLIRERYKTFLDEKIIERINRED